MASRLGADAVGMIFHPPARRNVTIDRGRAIVAALGAFVTPVGVFVDAATDRVLEVAHEVGLGLVQLHGQEPVEQVQAIVKAGLRVLKAVRVDAGFEREVERWKGIRGLAGIVLETAGTSGGAGVANDFGAIRGYQERGCLDGLSMVVAGGLSVENVGEVVRMLRPWGVDVSSGVETELGVKGEERVRRFIELAQVV